MLNQETESVSKLIVGPTAQNLIRAFFYKERLKGQAKGGKFNPVHVHVIGAGVMGGDIASWLALSGYKVTLQDVEPKRIAPAIKRAAKLYRKKLKAKRPVQEAMDRLIPDIKGEGVARADVVIEAIIENADVKKEEDDDSIDDDVIYFEC